MKRYKVAEKKEEVTYRISPRGKKMYHAKSLYEIGSTFTSEEIEDSNIQVIYRSVVVGELYPQILLDELMQVF